MKISIIIPCYNEKKTILSLIKKVEDVDLGNIEKEIIIIDDFSSDGTRELIQDRLKKYKLIFHNKNLGKGSALRTGFKHITGDIIIIQDADLEYDPNDYKNLIQPIIDKKYKVVYGSRERNKQNKTHSGLSFYLGGRVLTWLTNLLYRSELTDEPTCYKVFDKNLLLSIPLKCKKFEFCPEITAKILKKGIEIKEIPISYCPRTSKEGKKIKFRDGVEAVWTLLKYRFIN